MCAGEPDQLVAMINEHIEQWYVPAGGVWEGRRGYWQGMILKTVTQEEEKVDITGSIWRPIITTDTEDVPF